MKEMELHYALLEEIPAAIAVFKRDETGAIKKVYSNQHLKKLFGREEAFYNDAEDILDVVHPDDRSWLGERISQAVAANEGMDETYRLNTSDGSLVWVHHISNVHPQADGTCNYHVVYTDVTLQKVLEEENKATLSEQFEEYFEKRFDVNDKDAVLSVMRLQRAMLRSIADMYVVMYLIDLRSDTFIEIACMDHVKKLFGNAKSTKQVLKLVVENFVAPDFRESARAFNDMDTLAERMKGKRVISMDYDATIAGWCRQQFIAVSWDENGLVKEAICIEQRIQAEKMKIDKLRKQAETDGLTGLINRTSGAAYIDEELKTCNTGMFCLFDVDNFKHYNDEYGHDVGDAVLRGISVCMREFFRKNDILIRLGGDEFGIYVPGDIDETDGRERIDQFCKRVEELNFSQFEERVCISAGIAFADGQNYKNFDQIFKVADTLMYQCKRKKKGRS